MPKPSKRALAVDWNAYQRPRPFFEDGIKYVFCTLGSCVTLRNGQGVKMRQTNHATHLKSVHGYKGNTRKGKSNVTFKCPFCHQLRAMSQWQRHYLQVHANDPLYQQLAEAGGIEQPPVYQPGPAHTPVTPAGVHKTPPPPKARAWTPKLQQTIDLLLQATESSPRQHGSSWRTPRRRRHWSRSRQGPMWAGVNSRDDGSRGADKQLQGEAGKATLTQLRASYMTTMPPAMVEARDLMQKLRDNGPAKAHHLAHDMDTHVGVLQSAQLVQPMLLHEYHDAEAKLDKETFAEYVRKRALMVDEAQALTVQYAGPLQLPLFIPGRAREQVAARSTAREQVDWLTQSGELHAQELPMPADEGAGRRPKRAKDVTTSSQALPRRIAHGCGAAGLQELKSSRANPVPGVWAGLPAYRLLGDLREPLASEKDPRAPELDLSDAASFDLLTMPGVILPAHFAPHGMDSLLEMVDGRMLYVIWPVQSEGEVEKRVFSAHKAPVGTPYALLLSRNDMLVLPAGTPYWVLTLGQYADGVGSEPAWAWGSRALDSRNLQRGLMLSSWEKYHPQLTQQHRHWAYAKKMARALELWNARCSRFPWSEEPGSLARCRALLQESETGPPTRCQCEKGCSNGNCTCAKAGRFCGPACHTASSGCRNCKSFRDEQQLRQGVWDMSDSDGLEGSE